MEAAERAQPTSSQGENRLNEPLVRLLLKVESVYLARLVGASGRPPNLHKTRQSKPSYSSLKPDPKYTWNGQCNVNAPIPMDLARRLPMLPSYPVDQPDSVPEDIEAPKEPVVDLSHWRSEKNKSGFKGVYSQPRGTFIGQLCRRGQILHVVSFATAFRVSTLLILYESTMFWSHWCKGRPVNKDDCR